MGGSVAVMVGGSTVSTGLATGCPRSSRGYRSIANCSRDCLSTVVILVQECREIQCGWPKQLAVKTCLHSLHIKALSLQISLPLCSWTTQLSLHQPKLKLREPQLKMKMEKEKNSLHNLKKPGRSKKT